ncbi:MAG: twin-arginine translocase subunit TatC [Candidatus Eisenbacteria bacterium]|uniref:Sec-independent protein translocase protein TatC n=1 Tax=Eiseniibacteriota bacterium TaxID=2212470 RepID=A0A956SBC0_UNCEI|nr:twin-arginine translocase subunit TatC [Candidatus Eisenbacteria bacterium]
MKLLGKAQEREMPFLEHLEELRRAILGALGAIVVCSIVAYVFSGPVVDFVVVQHVEQAQFLRPMEAFLARIKVSLLLGLIGSLPFVMFQIWNFVVPGLLEQEKRLVLPMVVFSTLLFIIGTAFSYLVLTPTMVKLLVGFGTEHVYANISVEYLLDFIIRLALACGILFQLPLVVALLTIVRIVTPQFLWSKWRHAIVAILIVAAVATPGDGPSQIVLATPIIVLYFLSILVSLLIVRGRHDDPEAGEDDEPGPGNDDGNGAEPTPVSEAEPEEPADGGAKLPAGTPEVPSDGAEGSAAGPTGDAPQPAPDSDSSPDSPFDLPGTPPEGTEPQHPPRGPYRPPRDDDGGTR